MLEGKKYLININYVTSLGNDNDCKVSKHPGSRPSVFWKGKMISLIC